MDRFEAHAGEFDFCDVCFGTTGVRHLSIGERWRNPDDGSLSAPLAWYTLYLCDTCALPDGGLVSRCRWDGFSVIRTGTASPWRGRLVIIPADTRH